MCVRKNLFSFLLCVCVCITKKKKKRVIILHCLRECVVCSIGMTILPRPALTCLAPPRPVRVFPAPQRWWGRDRAIFCPRTMGWGGAGMGLVFLSPTHPALPHPVPTLIKTIIVNLVIRK